MAEGQDGSEGIQGPKVGRVAGVAGSGAAGAPEDLPYAGDKRGLGAWIGVIVAGLVVVVGLVLLLSQGGSDKAGKARTAGTTNQAAGTGGTATETSNTTDTSNTGAEGTGAANTKFSSTTNSPPPTTSAPTTTTPATTTPPTTVPPPPTPPVAPHPTAPHRAVYRDGKLYLEGAVPNQQIAKAFFDKAAAVIGPQNVINNYVIDPAAPVPTDGRVTVDQRFLFPTGSAVLDPSYSNVLELGVIVMRLNPQVVMVITGYTDNTGDPNDNLLLSQARASAVVNYLSARGIDVGRFRPIGKGAADPVAPNDNDVNRALNRRIEVTLLNLLAQ